MFTWKNDGAATLFFGTIYGSAEQKSGTIKWNSDNSIASSNPSLKK